MSTTSMWSATDTAKFRKVLDKACAHLPLRQGIPAEKLLIEEMPQDLRTKYLALPIKNSHNGYGYKERRDIAMGVRAVIACPCCGRPMIDTQSSCSVACKAVLTSASASANKDKLSSMEKKFQPKVPTSSLTRSQIKGFRKVLAEGGTKLTLYKALQKENLLSTFLGIKALTHYERVAVAKGEVSISFCKSCGSPCNVGKTFCANQKCIAMDEDVQERKELTTEEHYGVRHTLQNKQMRSRYKKTMVKRYGVDSPLKNTEILAKVRSTTTDRYGAPTMFLTEGFTETRKDAYMEHYGVEHPFMHPSVKRKREKTMVARYGVRSSMQNREILERKQVTACQKKTIKVGRRTVDVQGYEPQAIEYLISTGTRPRDIHFGTDVPSFKYKGDWESKSGRARYYHPDMLIGEDLIVEVKSLYTFLTMPGVFEVLKRKRLAVIQSGFRFKLMVMTAKGKKIPVPKYWYLKTQAQVEKIMVLE